MELKIRLVVLPPTPKAFAKSWMSSDSGSSDDGSNKKPLLRKRHCSAKAASNVTF